MSPHINYKFDLQEGKSWFERNPKKTLAVFLLCSFMGMFFMAEKILETKNKVYRSGIIRHIRLREHAPLFSNVMTPSKSYMKSVDTLVPKEFLLRTDENGFIVPSRIHDKPDFTIVFLGGSTTECLYVDEENRFPYLVGRLLEKETGLKVNSFNSGVSANNTLHSIDILLNKVVPMKPNVVIMMHNMNDLVTLLHEHSYWNKNSSRSPIVELEIFDLMRKIKNLTIPALSNEFQEIYENLNPPDEFQATRLQKRNTEKVFPLSEFSVELQNEFSINLQIFIDICRERKIAPVLMTEANRLKTNPDELVIETIKRLELNHGITYVDFKGLFDTQNQTIRSVGSKNNILIIDLAEKIPQEKEFIYDILHFNDKGSISSAKIISDGLKQLVPQREVSEDR